MAALLLCGEVALVLWPASYVRPTMLRRLAYRMEAAPRYMGPSGPVFVIARGRLLATLPYRFASPVGLPPPDSATWRLESMETPPYRVELPLIDWSVGNRLDATGWEVWYWHAIVPLPAVAAALLLGPALWFGVPAARQVRASRRRKRGLCVTCGYDLRGGNSAACPECGRER